MRKEERMKNLLLIFLVMLIGASYGFNDKKGVSARVVKVIDGNTVEILTEDNELLKIIFKDVDSPEIGQEHGDQAKVFTEKLVLKKKVIVEMKGKDMWGNRLASITLKNGKNIEQELLKAGMAWHNILKSKDAALAELESITKENKVGLWNSENPVAPWVYRREQTMTTAKSM